MDQFTQTQMEALSAFVAPDRFSTGQSNRELHIKDISPHRGKLPAGIIWPVTTSEVSAILAYTYAQGIPAVHLAATVTFDALEAASDIVHYSATTSALNLWQARQSLV